MRRAWPFLLIGTAWAHHGQLSGSPFLSGLAHPFTGLDHLTAALAVGLWGSYFLGRKALLPAALFISAVGVGALLGGAGVALPLAETAATFSVLALGLMLLFAFRKTSFALPLVALFGLLHGNLHGLEAPTFGYAYLAGILLSTAFLHAAGLLTGSVLKDRGLRAAGALLVVLSLLL
ncbi:MAG: HupE/UreJ family protein [Aquificae bacterium]|nr:HupE/UreJ family protein [Aquificota bacterium]